MLEIRQKVKKIRAYFDAPPNCADALCATYVKPRSGKPTFALNSVKQEEIKSLNKKLFNSLPL